jgi:hypothetical protein
MHTVVAHLRRLAVVGARALVVQRDARHLQVYRNELAVARGDERLELLERFGEGVLEYIHWAPLLVGGWGKVLQVASTGSFEKRFD